MCWGSRQYSIVTQAGVRADSSARNKVKLRVGGDVELSRFKTMSETGDLRQDVQGRPSPVNKDHHENE